MNLDYAQLRRYAPGLDADARRLGAELTLAGVAVDRVIEGDGRTLLELEITTNRPDLLSYLGIAREAALLRRIALVPPDLALAEDPSEESAELITVVLEAPDLCPRYTARIVRGVEVKESPAWLKAVLEASGIRPISNVVDVTNFVLLEMGHPLHAFDLDRLEGGKIVVRRAGEGEAFTTLDGKERKLSARDLVIADARRPVALAGVMGGAASEVSASTRDVLIESAYFDPKTIRRTAKQQGLRTEASVRFERGMDPSATRRACDRAAQLIAEIACGRVLAGAVDAYPAPRAALQLKLRRDRLERILGLAVAETEVRRVLAGLGFELTPESTRVLDVSVPLSRPDIEREIDLIEEVARHVGLDQVPTVLPPLPPEGVAPSLAARREESLREIVRGAGLSEAVTMALVDQQRNRLYAPAAWEPVALLNPLSDRLAELPMTLFPGLLEVARINLGRGNADLATYEIAKVFRRDITAKLPVETLSFAFVLAGERRRHWSEPAARYDAWDATGLVQLVFAGLGLGTAIVSPSQAAGFLDGAVVEIRCDDTSLGWAGQLDPATLEAFDLSVPIYGAVLDLGFVFSRPLDRLSIAPVPRFPEASRDVSFLVRDASFAQVLSLIHAVTEPRLEHVALIDRYHGKGLPDGAVSLTLRLHYRHPERTLEADEIAAMHGRVVAALEADPRLALRV